MPVPLPPPPPPPPPPVNTTLTVLATHDYRGATIGETTSIVFATTDFARALFNSFQFGVGKISDTVLITGDANRNFIDVNLPVGGGSFSAAGWTFGNWVPFTPLQNDQVNLIGSDAADTITGSSQADSIVGNGGNDTLFGGEGSDILVGGAGLDTLSGGGGDDTYHLTSVSLKGGGPPFRFVLDTVVESAAGGIDTVLVHRIGHVTGYTLVANVENAFINAAGAFNVVGKILSNKVTGNDDVNVIDGGGGSDALSGQGGNDRLIGGEGLDAMTGGGGDDTYYVDSAGDVVVEGAGQGTLDWAAASVSYVLAAGVQIEKLSTTSSGASAAIDLAGNEFVQAITGNAGANRLDGKGGADTMTGLGGNDIYYIDNAGDRVIEGVSQGALDWVATSISYELGAAVQAEKFSTTSSGATAAINLMGNDFGQTITGNAGNNIISGKAGNDTLTGLGGADVFVFDTGLNSTINVDRITDFNVAADTIWLQNGIFTQIAGTGILTAGQFAANTTGLAQDANDRIIYETDTGKLFYDVNGNAAGGSFQFATLAAGLALTNQDFHVI